MANGELLIANGVWMCAVVMFTLLSVPVLQAQQQSGFLRATNLERYMKDAHPIGTFSLTFPGPGGGYTFVHIPTKEVMEWGDTLVNDHAYLLDLNVSGDGLYLAPDTMVSFSTTTPFEFVVPNSGGHIIHANMTPGHTHEDMRELDTTFNGTIGYGIIKKYISVFDFRRKELTFYSLLSPDSVTLDDTNAMQLPLVDDAMITYCHCAQPTIWLDVNSPPFPEGHVNLAFQDPESEIFRPGLDSVTGLRVDAAHRADSIAGRRRPIGIKVKDFIVHDLAGREINLAVRGEARYIADMPPIYHDFNVPVMGALGTDVLRTYSGLIIDPTRGKLIFVK